LGISDEQLGACLAQDTRCVEAADLGGAGAVVVKSASEVSASPMGYPLNIKSLRAGNPPAPLQIKLAKIVL
jgi:hypothetical protein